jgi:hypothetical protein
MKNKGLKTTCPCYVSVKMSTKFDLRYVSVPELDPSDLNFETEAEKLLQTSLFIDGGAGFGKSFLMKKLMEQADRLGLKYVILAPTNQAAENLEGVTIHHFARVTEHVDIIFLDEPGFLGEDEFRFLLQRKTKWPETRHIYAGEFHQLGPVNDELLQINETLRGDYMHSAPMLWLVDCRRMELKTYHRGDAQLGLICSELRQAVIDRTVDEVDPLLFPVRVETDVNISYVHRIRKKVIAERMTKFIQTKRYSVHVPANPKDDKSQDVDLCEGMPLIAHRRWEEKHLKNSARGTIVSVSSFTGGGPAQTDELVITLDRTGDLIEMQTSDFHRFWRPAFCITVHQSQCTTIDQAFTIFGWNHEYMMGPGGPRGRYVAVSRGTKMEYVQICLDKGYDR